MARQSLSVPIPVLILCDHEQIAMMARVKYIDQLMNMGFPF